jgi:hypothetical protein
MEGSKRMGAWFYWRTGAANVPEVLSKHTASLYLTTMRTFASLYFTTMRTFVPSAYFSS